MLWFAFDPGARTIVLLVPLFVCIGISMLVGVFFPYVRTDLIDQSIVGDRKWLGIHRMSIMCAAGTIIMAFWNMLEDPIASGTDRTPLWVTLGDCRWHHDLLLRAARSQAPRRRGHHGYVQEDSHRIGAWRDSSVDYEVGPGLQREV